METHVIWFLPHTGLGSRISLQRLILKERRQKRYVLLPSSLPPSLPTPPSHPSSLPPSLPPSLSPPSLQDGVLKLRKPTMTVIEKEVKAARSPELTRYWYEEKRGRGGGREGGREGGLN